MTTDFTKTPPEERDLTIQEQLLLTHMQTIGNQQKILSKIAILEDRITKLEQTIEEITNQEVWTVLNDEDTKISEKFFS